MKLLYIHEYRYRFGVEPICRVLTEHDMKIAPKTYFAWLKQPVSDAAIAEAYLANELFDLYVENFSVYGVRKLWRAALKKGLPVGRDQVGRLMRLTGIQGVRRGVHRTVTTRREQRSSRFPDLVDRGWSLPARPDALWVSDFTYVWAECGFCYVSFVTDVYSRRILGWAVTTRPTTDLVISALDQAVAVRQRARGDFTGNGLIHHSDAGAQYTALAFTEALREAGIAGSIGSVGDALDNALMESTIGLYKTELIKPASAGRNLAGAREVERLTAEWVWWYNNGRVHSSIGYATPVEREFLYDQAIAQQGEAA